MKAMAVEQEVWQMRTGTEQRVYLDPTALRDGVERLGLGGYETLIERLRPASSFLVSDVYALQQIVYEHHLSGDTDYGYRLSELVQSVLAEVYPITENDLLISRWLGEEYPNLLARERLHLAVMRNHGITTLVTGRHDRYRHLNGIELVSIRTLLSNAAASVKETKRSA